MNPLGFSVDRILFKATGWGKGVLLVFDAASSSEIANSVDKIPLGQVAVAFVVVDFVLSTYCSTTFSVVASCVDESTDGLGRVNSEC